MGPWLPFSHQTKGEKLSGIAHECVPRRRYIPGTSYTRDAGDIVNTLGQYAAMPWKEHGVMEERLRFIEEWRSQDWTIAELCRFYGVTRTTGYKWLGR
jgi:hypothetical protein